MRMFSNHGTLTCRAEPKAPAEARSYSGRGPGYDKIADIHKPHCRYLAMCVKKWLTALAQRVPARATTNQIAPADGQYQGGNCQPYLAAVLVSRPLRWWARGRRLPVDEQPQVVRFRGLGFFLLCSCAKRSMLRALPCKVKSRLGFVPCH